MKRLIAAAAAVLLTGTTYADLILGYTSASNTGSGLVSDAPAIPGLTPQNLVQGPGLTVAAGATFNYQSWTLPAGSTVADAIASNDYFSFGFTLSPGYIATVTNLNIRYDRSGTGPASVSLRYSGDAFGADLFTDATVLDTGENNIIPLSLSGLTGSVEFRLYGYNASAAGGTFDLENTAAFNNRAVELQGTVVIPEPGSVALFGLGALVVTLYRRRRC